MTDHLDALKTLHTSLIDSRNGYEEALEDAEGKDLTPLFREMIDMRNTHAGELEPYLTALGETPDDDGSFMSTVHRTVISIRSILTDLDDSILPGLIDGEERIVKGYDEAIRLAPQTSGEYQALRAQRAAVQKKIDAMKSMAHASA